MRPSWIHNSPPRNTPYVWNLIFTVLKQYSTGKHYHIYDKNKKIHKHKDSTNARECDWLSYLTNSRVKSTQGNEHTTQMHSQKMKRQPMSLFPTPTELQDFMLGPPI